MDAMNQLTEKFVTDIRANGLKLFSYSLMAMDPESLTPKLATVREGKFGKGRRTDGARADAQGGFPGFTGRTSEKIAERIAKILDHQLIRKLKETAYCRDGFIELERYVGRSGSQIRGECREGASEADRSKFGVS